MFRIEIQLLLCSLSCLFKVLLAQTHAQTIRRPTALLGSGLKWPATFGLRPKKTRAVPSLRMFSVPAVKLNTFWPGISACHSRPFCLARRRT